MRFTVGTVVAALAAGQMLAEPPVVDHHQHLYSPALVAMVPGFKIIAADDLITLLDEAGIKQAAVFSTAYTFSNPNRPAVDHEYDQVKAENDWTSQQISKYPDRLRGFCGINPLRDYALDELARCAKDRYLHFGLKMHFGNSDVDVDNPQHVARLRQVFHAANEHRMAIVVHMRSTISTKRPYGAKEAAVFLTELIPAAPDVPIQIAHLTGGGGFDDPLVDQALSVFADAASKHDPRLARVLFDVSAVTGLGQWRDKVDRVASRIRQLGVERILYGSDGANGANYPPRAAWAMFRNLPLTDAEFRTIASNVAPYMK